MLEAEEKGRQKRLRKGEYLLPIPRSTPAAAIENDRQIWELFASDIIVLMAERAGFEPAVGG